ncbi:MAG: hypothetical protein MMC33_010900 [Icmadophila ericetorum]|nr:hypothetical protein [Icmadophila ericetorum]
MKSGARATTAELKDEYGIKVLYGPDEPRAEYALIYCQLDSAKQSDSVLFVHGLTGRQLSTWTAPGATASVAQSSTSRGHTKRPNLYLWLRC